MTTAGSSGRRSVERAMTTRHAPCCEIARSGVTRSDEAFTLAQCLGMLTSIEFENVHFRRQPVA